MALNKYEDLTEMHLDVLQEIGNIGAGNASTALSSMIGREVLIAVPSVRVLGFQEAIDEAGGAERLVAGVLSRMSGGIEGMFLVLMEQDFADLVIQSFFGSSDCDVMNLNENEVSALSEICNIMVGAYSSAISSMTGLEIDIAAPQFQADMLGALMSVPAIEFGEVGDKLLFINKNIEIDSVSVKSNMMLIPTIESLETIMNKLGIEI